MVKPSPSHILIVEDDAKVRLLLRRCFEGEGFRVSEAGSGAEAMQRLAAGSFDLVTLDLQLPDGDGFAVGREIRAQSAVPIIMVTGKGDTIDRVVGLELGADDYITKPFSPRELVARVRAVLRRTRPAAPAERLSAAGITIDLARHRVEVDGRAIMLAPREFALLQTLVGSPGRVFSREQLLTRAWGYARADEIESRTVDVHIRRLRSKLGAAGDRIVTIKGVGYQLDTD
jgi:two-component system response regulator ResD